MTSIEFLLNKIPLRITRYIEGTCYSCGNKHFKKCEYSLKLEISQHEIRPNVVKKRYHLFYETSSFGNGDKRKFIGNSCGLGYSTIKEAIKDLLKFKKVIRGT